MFLPTKFGMSLLKYVFVPMYKIKGPPLSTEGHYIVALAYLLIMATLSKRVVEHELLLW